MVDTSTSVSLVSVSEIDNSHSFPGRPSPINAKVAFGHGDGCTVIVDGSEPFCKMVPSKRERER
jgi:hypothetical protein